ncbi:hypothetical protein Dimus_028149 [Dionaea muscipula]
MSGSGCLFLVARRNSRVFYISASSSAEVWFYTAPVDRIPVAVRFFCFTVGMVWRLLVAELPVLLGTSSDALEGLLWVYVVWLWFGLAVLLGMKLLYVICFDCLVVGWFTVAAALVL